MCSHALSITVNYTGDYWGRQKVSDSVLFDDMMIFDGAYFCMSLRGLPYVPDSSFRLYKKKPLWEPGMNRYSFVFGQCLGEGISSP